MLSMTSPQPFCAGRVSNVITTLCTTTPYSTTACVFSHLTAQRNKAGRCVHTQTLFLLLSAPQSPPLLLLTRTRHAQHSSVFSVHILSLCATSRFPSCFPSPLIPFRSKAHSTHAPHSRGTPPPRAPALARSKHSAAAPAATPSEHADIRPLPRGSRRGAAASLQAHRLAQRLDRPAGEVLADAVAVARRGRGLL